MMDEYGVPGGEGEVAVLRRLYEVDMDRTGTVSSAAQSRQVRCIPVTIDGRTTAVRLQVLFSLHLPFTSLVHLPSTETQLDAALRLCPRPAAPYRAIPGIAVDVRLVSIEY